LGYARLLDIGRAGPISLDAESSAPVLWPLSFTLTYVIGRIRSLIPNSWDSERSRQMKLYYWPGACSLSPHIVSREAGIDLQLAELDRAQRKTQDGTVLSTVNPKNQVPVLELDNGQRLTEGPVIVQYLADQKPGSGLVPPPGTMERYRVQEWLNFITSELHKTFGPLFRPSTPEEFKKISREYLAQRFDWIDKQLASKKYLMGDTFTVADAYLFTVLRWSPRVGIDLSKWPNIEAYLDRVAARPKVKEAMKAEGLLQ
jgi:glutathione S-transferase